MYVWRSYVLNNVGLGFGSRNSIMRTKWKYPVAFSQKKLMIFCEKGNSILYVSYGCKFSSNLR